MQKQLFGECLSEFIGTFVLLFVGIASVAALVVAGVDISWWSMSISWGLAVTFGIYISGFISGGHLNPAVTISLAVWKGFDKKKVIPYIISQVLGAFAGASVVYVLYGEGIRAYEKAQNIVRASQEGWATAGIFSTFPKPYLSIFQAFMVELAITAFLMLVILAVTDPKNGAAPKGGIPALAIGLTVTILGLSFGPLTGFAMNPARDFGPRLFLLLGGWGSAALGPNLYGLIVPIFGPIVGAIIAGAVWEKLIVPYFPKSSHDVPVQKSQHA